MNKERFVLCIIVTALVSLFVFGVKHQYRNKVRTPVPIPADVEYRYDVNRTTSIEYIEEEGKKKTRRVVVFRVLLGEYDTIIFDYPKEWAKFVKGVKLMDRKIEEKTQ